MGCGRYKLHLLSYVLIATHLISQMCYLLVFISYGNRLTCWYASEIIQPRQTKTILCIWKNILAH